MINWRKALFDPKLLIAALLFLPCVQTVTQTEFDIVTDIESAHVGLFAWMPNSERFTFMDTSLIVMPTQEFLPQMPDPVWEAYDLQSGSLVPPMSVWPLQAEFAPSQFPDALPNQFAYASPERSLFLYQREGQAQLSETVAGSAEIALANPITNESLSLGIPARLPFSPQSDAQLLWASSGRAVVFSTTNAGANIVEPLQIYWAAIRELDPLQVLIRQFGLEVGETTYALRAHPTDRLLAIAPNGDSVLLIGSPISNEVTYAEPSSLILWYPDRPETSKVITSFSGEAICQAAFLAGAVEELVIVLDDGRIAVYETMSNRVRFSPTRLTVGCGNNYFSPNGRWLAVPYNSLGRIAFLEMTRVSSELRGEALYSPVAEAEYSANVTGENDETHVNITLDASSSWDSDGHIVDYVWSIGRNPLMNNGSTVLLDLPCVHIGEGMQFVLTVRDDDGLVGTDRVEITCEP